MNIVDKVFDMLDKMESKGGLTVREDQNNLMLDIAERMDEGGALIAEAGVGIGKSYAYLIPGLIYAKYISRTPLIVSSSSIQLTEQLIKDVRGVSEICDDTFSIVVGKGTRNYPCYNRFIKKYPKSKVSIDEMHFRWGMTKTTEQEQYCVERCLFNQCTYKQDCEFFQMRMDLRSYNSKNCIVVNHNLLVEHLKRKRDFPFKKQLIQDGHTIVIDEAHKFEEVVRDSLSSSLGIRHLDQYKRLITQLGFNAKRYIGIYSELKGLFEDIHNQLSERFAEETDDITNQRIDIEEILLKESGRITQAYYELEDIQDDLRYTDYPDHLTNVYETLEELVSILKELFRGISKDRVVKWCSYKNKFTKNDLYLNSAPKDIDFEIKDLLMEEVLYRSHETKSVIFLSATLGSGVKSNLEDYYSYQKHSLGLPQSTLYAEPRDSPFNYSEQTILYNPGKMIDVTVVESSKSIAKEIIRLSNLTQGRTMVLFTAKKQLNNVYQELLDLKHYYSWELLKQSSDTVKTINRFKETKGVLLVTGVFWEGINIPGNDLSSLIIVRLPYPVPDPIFEYKYTKIKGVYESEMILKLKQGAGRLIRTESDFGILTILDKRLAYKKNVVAQLPYGNPIENFEDVEKFWNEKTLL